MWRSHCESPSLRLGQSQHGRFALLSCPPIRAAAHVTTHPVRRYRRFSLNACYCFMVCSAAEQARREASARPARRTTRVHTWGNCPELNASRQVHGQTTARSFVLSRVRSCSVIVAAGEIGSGFGKIEEMVTMQVGSHPGNLDFIDSLADCAFTTGSSGSGCGQRMR